MSEAEKENLRLQLQYTNNELLRTNGLLTSRGIVEYFVRLVAGEYHRNTGNYKKEPAVSEVLRVLGKGLSLSGESRNKFISDLPGSNAVALFTFLTDCHFTSSEDAEKIYQTLSQNIHGYSWYGASVRVYCKDMSPSLLCLIEKVAVFMKLGVTKETSIE